MLDSLPVWARDLVLLVVPVLLGWASTDLVPQLQSVNPLLAVLASAVLTQLVAYFTPATRAYGFYSARRQAARERSGRLPF